MTIEAEMSAAGVPGPGEPPDRATPRRPAPGAPDDGVLARGHRRGALGPADRRRFLDETLAVVDPKAARSAEEVDKVLRQRAALLRRPGGALAPDVAATLDVWDARLDEAGTALVEAREALVEELAPLADRALLAAGREPTDVGTGLPPLVGPAAARRLDRAPATKTSSGVSPRSVPTATSSS